MAISSIYSALTGIRTSLERSAISANNLANLSTPGYKSKRPVLTTGFMGAGTKLSELILNTSMGALLTSDGTGSVAINGEGFFSVDLGDGQLGFTRDGNFSTDAAGNLVTPSGHHLLPPINVPLEATMVNFGKDGTVTATLAGGSTLILGQIQLVKFGNSSGLQSIGDNLLIATGAAGEPQIGVPGDEGFGELLSGFSESSNVDIASEMVGQINAQRTFEANLEIIRTADEVLGDLLDIKS